MKCIILKSIEGFGDRLEWLLQSIEYSKKTNRILIIDWSDEMWGDNDSNFEDYFFLNKLKYLTLNNFKNNYYSKNMSIIPKIWNNKLFLHPNKDLYNTEYILNNDNNIINDIINNHSKDFNEDIVVISGIKNRTFIYSNFKYIKLNIILKNNIYNTTIYKQLQYIPYICIHLRGGDKLIELNRKLQNKSNNLNLYVKNITSKLIKINMNKNIKNILILSDTKILLDYLKLKLKKIGNYKIYTSKNFLLDNNLINIGLHNLCKEELERNNLTKKIINFYTILDFYLLLNSKIIINDDISLFSNMAIKIKENLKINL